MLGFKMFKRVAVTIAGIELLRRIRKGQFDFGRLDVYRWRQEYGGLKVDQVKRLKELERRTHGCGERFLI
jgi:hypothetical protein